MNSKWMVFEKPKLSNVSDNISIIFIYNKSNNNSYDNCNNIYYM